MGFPTAVPEKVVCASGFLQKVGFHKIVLGPAHVEKVRVFCGHENRLKVILHNVPEPAPRGGLAPPIDMLGPPQLTMLLF